MATRRIRFPSIRHHDAHVIPVYEPYVGDEEAEAVAEAVRHGEISGSFGESIPSFERRFADYVGAKHGVAVTSGTTALQLAVAAAGIGPGDEVLVSASTNIATALAAYHNGAVPVAVDSEDETWNLDLDLVEGLISERTKAIIPVHLFGHPVDMDRLLEIAERHGLVVIEDCAESHGATVRGRMTGALGDMGCFSFYANKIITTGEGGMVTTDDDALAERLRLLRNLAFQRPRFLHEHAGYNFRMTGYQAAMGLVQLDRIEFILEQKRRVAQTYDRLLDDVRGIVTPVELDWARNVYWMYGIVVTEEFPLSRDQLIAYLAEREIESRTFFCPMNMQPFLRRQEGFRDVPCPVAERLWERGMYIPCGIDLADETLAEIVDHIRSAAGVPI
jgi:perosamine synthetase